MLILVKVSEGATYVLKRKGKNGVTRILSIHVVFLQGATAVDKYNVVSTMYKCTYLLMYYIALKCNTHFTLLFHNAHFHCETKNWGSQVRWNQGNNTLDGLLKMCFNTILFPAAFFSTLVASLHTFISGLDTRRNLSEFIQVASDLSRFCLNMTALF